MQIGKAMLPVLQKLMFGNWDRIDESHKLGDGRKVTIAGYGHENKASRTITIEDINGQTMVLTGEQTLGSDDGNQTPLLALTGGTVNGRNLSENELQSFSEALTFAGVRTVLNSESAEDGEEGKPTDKEQFAPIPKPQINLDHLIAQNGSITSSENDEQTETNKKVTISREGDVVSPHGDPDDDDPEEQKKKVRRSKPPTVRDKLDDKTGNEHLAKLTDGENEKSTEQDSEVAALNSPDGIEVHLTPEQTEYCLQDYSQIALKDSNKARAMAHWIKKDRLSQPFQAEGVLEALLNGPAPTGQDNEGYATYLHDNKGSYVYQNEVTGQYFIANPANLRDPNTLQVVDDLSSLTAEGSPFTPTHLLKVRSNVSPNVMKGREYWGTWEDYPKVVGSYKKIEDGKEIEITQDYAVVGGHLYTRHVIARGQPSGLMHPSNYTEKQAQRSVFSDLEKTQIEQRKPALKKKLHKDLIKRLKKHGMDIKKMSPEKLDKELNKELSRIMTKFYDRPGIYTFDGQDMAEGRSISPTYINKILHTVTPTIDFEGYRIYDSGNTRIVQSPEGAVITAIYGVDD